MSEYTIHVGDCLDVMRGMADNSMDAIVTDPPYYKVKGEAWDRQWSTADGFLSWLDTVLAEMYRILKPNGSLYLFASPKMAARVEVLIGQRFNVLNHIVWNKTGGTRANQASKDTLRCFFGNSERIIFAEHYGADGYAKGEAGYGAKCDELRGFVFEPLRAYLDGERLRAGVAHRDVIKRLGMTGHDSHFFSSVQWKLPLQEQYEAMRSIFSSLNHGGEYLQRPYEDLRREYEDLRREYEDLRRPFNVSADVQYTDVWTFPNVKAYPGKHPTEKPVEMMRHIISASTNRGAMVLDPFMGSGTTGVAAVRLGRDFIGIDISEKYAAIARARIGYAVAEQTFGLVSD